jgi:tetratricopeptide (TPR) repeat protein
VHYEQAQSERAAGHFLEAVRLVQAAPEAADLDEYAHAAFLLGWSQYELGQYESALESLLIAKGLRLSDPQRDQERRIQVELFTGWTLYRLQRYADAVTCLEEVVKPGKPLDGRNRAIGEYYWALACYALGRHQDAIALLQRLLHSGQDSDRALPREYLPTAYWCIGRIHSALDQYAEALPWLKKSLTVADEELQELEPIGSFAADCLVELGSPQEALPYAKEAYQRKPDDAVRAICFAKVLSALGDHPQARSILDAVEPERLTPWEHERLLAHKCWVFVTVGDRARYETCYRDLVAMNPQCKYLVDPSRTRWLPPPETLRWPEKP